MTNFLTVAIKVVYRSSIGISRYFYPLSVIDVLAKFHVGASQPCTYTANIAACAVLLQETVLETEFDGEVSKFTMRQVSFTSLRSFVACYCCSQFGKHVVPDVSVFLLAGVACATDASRCR